MQMADRNPIDAKTPTHDGQIWPRARQKMTSAAAIRARMAEEAGQAIRHYGDDAVITADDFRRSGWTDAQIAEHLPAAIDTATAKLRRAAA